MVDPHLKEYEALLERMESGKVRNCEKIHLDYRISRVKELIKLL